MTTINRKKASKARIVNVENSGMVGDVLGMEVEVGVGVAISGLGSGESYICGSVEGSVVTL